MPNPFPYFRWFPSDASGDEAYVSMTDQERGFFHRCLNHAWMNDGLPGDLDMLAAVMRVTRKYVDKVWPHVVVCGGWELTDTVHPRWINHRQEEERDHARGKSAKAGKASPHGQKGIPGFLYLMRRGDGAIKIGSSLNVQRRLAQVRYKYNEPIELVGKIRTNSMGDSELEAHDKYASKRLTGEWFSLAEADIRSILGGDAAITPGGDSKGDSGGDKAYHPTPRAYDSDSGSSSGALSSSAKSVYVLEPSKASSQRFEEWWTLWSSIRGSNHRLQGAQAWLSVVTIALEVAVFECTRSYLQSLDNPAKGYNPDNFLFEQAKDQFSARWPARASPDATAAERRRAETIAGMKVIDQIRRSGDVR